MLHCLPSFSTDRKREELPFSLKCYRTFLLVFQGCVSCPSDLGDEAREGCGWGTRCQWSLLLGFFSHLVLRDKRRWLVKTSRERNASRKHNPVGNWGRSEGHGGNKLHRCSTLLGLSPDSSRLSGSVGNSAAQRWPDPAHGSKSRLIICELKRFFDIGQI